MKLFIDTADISEIKEAAALGVLDGVTTNPSLVAKTGKPFRQVLDEIIAVVDGPISAEVVALDFKGMVKEGKELASIHKNIVVKVPLTVDGLKACKSLSDEGIPVNQTLCFSPMQALLSAKAGAAYISPFVGRLDDISQDGMELIRQVVEIYDNYGFATEVLVASIRNPIHMLESARMGADVATVPLKVIKQLLKHPLTDIGLENFMKDWENVPKE